LFLISRVIQAIGGGGIMPIANAFIGFSFPPEKRGTALGFVGAIYGVATILGPTMGSSILDIAGLNRWGFIFFINVPISIIILCLSYVMEESTGEASTKLDTTGSIVVSIMILSLMYALTNLNFFHFSDSIKNTNVWPYFIVFALSLPVFVFVENKAEDPILNLRYFKEKQIVLTLILGFMTGVGLMGVVFIPQFAENVLKLKTGNGGYLVTLMSVFAGVSAPLGGKFIDKYSAKLVMLLGFGCTTFGGLFLALVTTAYPSFLSIMTGLAFIGFGMGFTMGTPLNYLMLSYVEEKESASAISTLSLIRSIGVTISPNIMINFIVEAAKKLQGNVMAALPQPSVPAFSGSQYMAGAFDLSKMTATGGTISPDTLQKLQAADVTTIVDTIKDFLSSMLDKAIPGIKASIAKALEAAPKGVKIDIDFNAVLNSWKLDYLNDIEKHRTAIEKVFQDTLNHGYRNMFLAAAAIAFIGVIITLLLSNKNSGQRISHS
jgi:MFS family permease